ncbi:hypothetical protein BCON_0672g00020 [Botryotinia convoluta]|uniref:NAD(P)-binding domain-containing protein n=1 Tax=Botryotinia convoluta TaxID=54673 RepID=A0A4Z1HG40_9HELO|nr:hypothetical protein BCON_0672g00020 [Botryotinia convoluta]
MLKIFIIGATGHIGGAVLDLVYPSIQMSISKHWYEMRRKAKYSWASTHEEAKEADIVINTGPDVKQDIAISAILEGVANHTPKAYYIHTAGGSLIWDSPGSSQVEPKIFDDVHDIQALKSFPFTALHATSNAIYLSLLSSALNDPSPDPQKWVPEAFYFATSEDLSFGEYMTFLISKVSNPPYNLVHDTQIKELPFSEAVKVVGTLTAYLFGIDMQVRCTRAKEVLGWVPRAKKVGEGLDEVLEVYYKERDDGAGMQELDDTYGL